MERGSQECEDPATPWTTIHNWGLHPTHHQLLPHRICLPIPHPPLCFVSNPSLSPVSPSSVLWKHSTMQAPRLPIRLQWKFGVRSCLLPFLFPLLGLCTQDKCPEISVVSVKEVMWFLESQQESPGSIGLSVSALCHCVSPGLCGIGRQMPHSTHAFPWALSLYSTVSDRYRHEDKTGLEHILAIDVHPNACIEMHMLLAMSSVNTYSHRDVYELQACTPEEKQLPTSRCCVPWKRMNACRKACGPQHMEKHMVPWGNHAHAP